MSERRTPVLFSVVQSLVSLTSSLIGKLVKCLSDFIANKLIVFLSKMREAFAQLKLLSFFQQKCWRNADSSV